MSGFYRDPAKITTFLESWIRERLNKAKARGGVLGLSGGIDSAVMAALLRRILSKDDMLAVIMPCKSMPKDEEDARAVIAALDIPFIKVDLTGTFCELTQALKPAGELSELAKANIKPRLRMATLYSIAASRNFLVFGASNKDELTFGYYTKYGDSGVDILPLGELLKGEIRAMAKYLGVPRQIIEKAPTAGLWSGQTDEDEMGVAYEDIDKYIATGEVDESVRKIVVEAYLKSAHKREMPPIAAIPND